MGNKVSIAGRTVSLVRQVGEGGKAVVYYAKDSAGRHFAVKRVLYSEPSQLRETEAEMEAHQRATGHKNVCTLYGTTRRAGSGSDPGEVLALMEFCPLSLSLHIQRKRGRLEESEVLGLFSQICEAVAHLHSLAPPLVHRDIKVENVLLAEDGRTPKLIDFGSATTRVIQRGASKEELARAEVELQSVTTLEYRAPEAADVWARMPIGPGLDVWALGCTLYAMCYGSTPFGTSNLHILSATVTFPDAPAYSNGLKNVMREIFVADPDNRPDIFQVLEMVSELLRVSNPYGSLVRPKRATIAISSSEKVVVAPERPTPSPVLAAPPAYSDTMPPRSPRAGGTPSPIGSACGSPSPGAAGSRMTLPPQMSPAAVMDSHSPVASRTSLRPTPGLGSLAPPPSSGRKRTIPPRSSSGVLEYQSAASPSLAPAEASALFPTADQWGDPFNTQPRPVTFSAGQDFFSQQPMQQQQQQQQPMQQQASSGLFQQVSQGALAKSHSDYLTPPVRRVEERPQTGPAAVTPAPVAPKPQFLQVPGALRMHSSGDVAPALPPPPASPSGRRRGFISLRGSEKEKGAEEKQKSGSSIRRSLSAGSAAALSAMSEQMIQEQQGSQLASGQLFQ